MLQRAETESLQVLLLLQGAAAGRDSEGPCCGVLLQQGAAGRDAKFVELRRVLLQGAVAESQS